MRRKITRIFLNSIATLFVAFVLLSFTLLLAIQSYTFQTWLGKKASSYLSKELNTKVEIQQIRINFFSSLQVKSLLVCDLHQDTLFQGNIDLNIQTFNVKEQVLKLRQTVLRDSKIKLIRYQQDSVLNLNYLLEYFSSKDTLTSPGPKWELDAGEVILKNISFAYHDQSDNTSDKNHIQYNHLQVSELSGHFKKIDFTGDSLRVNVEELQLKERSGFQLKNLSALVSLNSKHLVADQLNLQTAQSHLHGKIAFHHKDWEDYSDFIYKVQMDCELKKPSLLNSKDIAYFTKELDGLDQSLSLAAKIKGTVSELRLSELDVLFGNQSRYQGYLSIQGLPDIETSFIHLDANEFTSRYEDLMRIPSYPFHLGNKLPLPIELKALGLIRFKGKFDGFLSDFTTYGKFITDLGKAETRLSLKLGVNKEDLEYHGKISTENFNLGKLLGNDAFHSVSMSGELTGKGLDINNLLAGFNFDIKNLAYHQYQFTKVNVQGHLENKLFNGMLISLDTNLHLDFNGSIDFSKPVPDLQFISTINRMDLSALKFLTQQDSGIVSAQVLIDTRGSSINDLSGQIHIDNLIYSLEEKKYKLSNLNLDLDQTNTVKEIDLHSAYLNASLKGKYNLSNLLGVFQGFLHTYYPTFFKKSIDPKTYTDSLALSLEIKNFTTLHELFFENIELSRNSKIEVMFDAGRNKFDLNAEVPIFEYRGFRFLTTKLQVNELGNKLRANLYTQAINFSDSNLVNQLQMTISSQDKDIYYKLAWENQDTVPNFGKLQGGISFNPGSLEIRCDTIQIKNAYNDWNLQSPNQITWLKDGSLLIQPLLLTNQDQEIKIGGNYSNSSTDSLVVYSHKVDMSSFNPLLRIFGLKFSGLLNGQMVFSNAHQLFVFRGNVEVSNFKLNDNALGNVILKTDYDNTGKFIKLQGQSSLGLGEYLGGSREDITFLGNYFLDGRDESIDIDFVAHAANLRLLNPLLEGILTVNNGFVKGQGKLHGAPKHLKIDSHLKLFQSDITVDYTGVHYYVSGEIDVLPDQIRFSDLLLRDRNMKSKVMGTLNGNIFHTNFENIRIDYDLNYKNMLVLNTNEIDNPYYYGKVYGSGNLGIYGYLNNLTMEINTSVDKNTKFVLPLDGPAELNDEGFVQFVVRDTLKKVKEKTFTGFNLDMNLAINPEAELSLIMDRKTGDILNVKGQGKLDLNINTLGKFDMTGDYIITEGEYLFTLKTLINKKFEIDAGSHITWSGDPMNAEIDVVTRYRQRASVAPLLNDTTGMYGARQPVDCKLVISGKLATPNIHFDIDVPNLEPTAMARIENVLSDEAELNRQVFSFLLFRSFTVPQIYTSQGGGVSAGSAAASTGSEMLSNRASEFLNSYFGNLTGITDMQVGVNYRPGTTSTGEEFDVALSKQFMNNRVSVDGNFGVNSNPNSSSSGLIGDVVVEYKLSEDGRYRVKVFNQTNDNTQVTILGGPYTQGIGVFYREEFNTFRELMEYYRKKTSRKK